VTKTRAALGGSELRLKRCALRRRSASGRFGLWALGALMLASGCQKLFGQDPARCDQSAATVRQAIGFKDFESARKWRDYTWKVCDDRAVVASLDKEILDAEAALAKEAQATAKKAQNLARKRINSAQALWLKFDAESPAARTRQNLDATRDAARSQAKGLAPEYAKQIDAYNDGEYQKRLSALPR
jgi:hypothetical protein